MTLRPRPVADVPPYSVPRATCPVDLRLDANEGAPPPPDVFQALAGVELLRLYPAAGALEARLATQLGVRAEQVLVTAGADDALDRCCRAVLAEGAEAIMPTPGFATMLRWIELSGARHVDVPWPEGPYPTDAVLAAVRPATRMIVVTTPNNPTGAVATAGEIQRIAAAVPEALVVVDLAYVEFADGDPSAALRGIPNVVLTRTFSKAWGLAGARVGYAVGDETVVGWLRACGMPYAVAGPSLALASRALDDESRVAAFVEAVRLDRERLEGALALAGAQPQPSQANFVLARVADPLWWRDGLAGLGIAIRAFPGVPRLEDAIRIACPGEPAAMARLEAAFRTLARPERLLVEGETLGIDGAESVAVVADTLDDRPTWVAVRTAQGLAAAREARALPVAIQRPDLVVAGAARSLDRDELASRWARTGGAR